MNESMREGWSSVENWRTRVSYHHGYHGENRLKNFLAYLGENEPKFRGATPDELVKFQQAAQGTDRFLILDALQRWVNSLSNLRA